MMATAGDLGIKSETILSLPIESLAYAVLRNFHETGGWNCESWLLAAKEKLDRGPHMSVLAEAWAWLETRGLVVRDFNQSSPTARVITRVGVSAIEKGDLSEVQAAERIGLELHSRLQGTIRPIFLLGDYEIAAFKAMKEVEVRVRALAGYTDDRIGVKLMRDAFNADGGPLVDPKHEGGERQARSDLFAGAIGCFKNPASHRSVTYLDPVEASEVVLLADLLMRILDNVESCVKAEN